MSARHAAYAALVGAVLFWGFSFIGTKIALAFFPPFTLVFLRFSAASIFFLIPIMRRGFPRFSRNEWLKLFLIALFEPGIYFACETVGLQFTTASKASLIIALVPIFVMIFARIFIGESIHRKDALSIGLSFAGIVILITGDPRFEFGLRGSALGDLLILGAVLAAGLYTILARDLGRLHSAMVITAFQSFFGAVFYLPLFILEFAKTPWSSITVKPVAALLYLILFATISAFLCYNFALSRIPAARAAVFINGIPVITTIAAWPLLGERLEPIQMLGGMLVLGAVYLATLSNRRYLGFQEGG
jgi:drug/metabolite transporter (DMT)-like permease